MKEIIEDNNDILAVVVRGGDWPEHLHFHTKDEDFLQVGTWNYPKGKKSSTHTHKIAERMSNRTNEAIFVRKGRLKAKIYSEEDKFLKEVVLEEGDLVIVFGGGHSFEALEDGTKVLEIKNGPYPGLEKDKRDIAV